MQCLNLDVGKMSRHNSLGQPSNVGELNCCSLMFSAVNLGPFQISRYVIQVCQYPRMHQTVDS